MRSDRAPDAPGLTRYAGRVVAAGLVGYAVCAPFSITAATVCLLTSIAGAIPLWLTRTRAPYVRLVVWSVAVYLFVKLVTALTALDVTAGMRGFEHHWPYLLFPVIPLVVRTGPSRALLLRTLAVSTSVVCVYAIVQYFWGFDLWKGGTLEAVVLGRYPARAFFDNQQTWSGFALVASLFFAGMAVVRTSDRWLYALVALLAVWAMVASNIRGTIVGYAGGIVAMAFVGARSRRYALAAIAAGAVVIALSPPLHYRLQNIRARAFNPEIQNSRLFIWKTAWAIGASRPWLGVGPGNFRTAYELHRSRPDAHVFGHAHNEWFHEWATSGVGGVVVFSLLYGVVAVALWRRRHLEDGLARAAFVAWIGLGVASLVQCHFRDEEVLMLIAFIAGLGLLSGAGAADPVNRTLSA